MLRKVVIWRQGQSDRHPDNEAHWRPAKEVPMFVQTAGPILRLAVGLPVMFVANLDTRLSNGTIGLQPSLRSLPRVFFYNL